MSALVLVVGHRFCAAIALAAIGAIVVSNIDNVTRLMVNRRVSNLRPMATLVGAFAGVGVFGLAGVLLGPLAISYFFELVHIYRQEYGAPLAAPPMSTVPIAAAASTRAAVPAGSAPGRDDFLFRPECQAILADRPPHATLEIIGRAGYDPRDENSGASVEPIRTFLRRELQARVAPEHVAVTGGTAQ